MHGLGIFGDLLTLGFYMIDAMAWMYFWVLCISHRKNLFGEMKSYKWALLIVACVGLTAIGIYLAAVETFKRHNSEWWLVILGAALPVFGIFYIQGRRESNTKN